MDCMNFTYILVFCSILLTNVNSASNANFENVQGSGSGYGSGTDDEDYRSSGRTNNRADITDIDIGDTGQSPSVKVLGCSRDSARLSYQPTCDPLHPEFYQPKQCTKNHEDCFCVNAKSGLILEKTRTSSTARLQANSINCEPVFFHVTLGFAMPWNSNLASNESSDFRDLARKVEAGIDALYEGETMAGWQSARLLAFRKGSVVAHIQLTSIGHSVSGTILYKSLKKLMNTFVDDQLSEIAGYKILPEKYRFTSRDEDFLASKDNSKSVNLSTDNSIQEDSNVVDNDDKINSASTVFQQKTLNYNGVNVVGFNKSFFNQPILLGVVIASAIALIIISVLIVLYCVYRVRKADEGSYALDGDQKKSPLVNHSVYQVYQRAPTQEFYA